MGVYCLHTGAARLVEDTTGQGNTTRSTGGDKCITSTIPLADQG